MIALGDKTALGSDEAIARLAAMRRMDAEEAQDVAGALATLQGAPDIPAAIHLLISKASIDARQSTDARQESPGHGKAQRHLAFLQSFAAPLAEHPEALIPYMKFWQVRAQVLLEHASVHRLGAAVKQGGGR